MSVPVDENALAQRVLTILAESLLASVRHPPEPATDDPPEAASSAAAAEPPKSIAEFCKSEGISRAFFYALKRRGMAPQLDEIIVPGEPGINRGRGLKLTRITAESARAWREMIRQVRLSEASKLEIARAHAQRVEAAKLSVASPNHVSRRPRPVRRRRPRRE